MKGSPLCCVLFGLMFFRNFFRVFVSWFVSACSLTTRRPLHGSGWNKVPLPRLQQYNMGGMDMVLIPTGLIYTLISRHLIFFLCFPLPRPHTLEAFSRRDPWPRRWCTQGELATSRCLCSEASRCCFSVSFHPNSRVILFIDRWCNTLLGNHIEWYF